MGGYRGRDPGCMDQSDLISTLESSAARTGGPGLGLGRLGCVNQLSKLVSQPLKGMGCVATTGMLPRRRWGCRSCGVQQHSGYGAPLAATGMPSRETVGGQNPDPMQPTAARTGRGGWTRPPRTPARARIRRTSAGRRRSQPFSPADRRTRMTAPKPPVGRRETGTWQGWQGWQGWKGTSPYTAAVSMPAPRLGSGEGRRGANQRRGRPAEKAGRPRSTRLPSIYLKLRSRRLLVTTNTDENAIAAPAIIGLSMPKAAKGRAATL